VCGFTARGVKTFVLQRRVNGKERRITIGRLGPLTAEQARREATKLLGSIATGRDPVAERKQAELAAVTLGETFTEYLSARGDLRPKTVKDYNRIMGVSFGDWRKGPLVEITGDLVGKRHAVLGERHGKAWANLSMRVLRALFNFAAANYEVGGKALVLDNPVKRLSRTRAWFRVDRRETLIKPHQLRPWMDAVLALDNGLARDYLQLVLLTGLRRSEALGLKWEDVDLLGRTLTVKVTRVRTGGPCAMIHRALGLREEHYRSPGAPGADAARHGGGVHRRRCPPGGLSRHRLHLDRARGAPAADRLPGEPAGGPRGDGGGGVGLAVSGVARLHAEALLRVRGDLRRWTSASGASERTLRSRAPRRDSKLHGDRRPV
jgi:hypothetical protein